MAGVHRNTLYHNNGDGTFHRCHCEGRRSNKPDPEYGPLWSVGGAWVDVNNDGLLDLVVINYLKWDVNQNPLCAGYGHANIAIPRCTSRRRTNSSSTMATGRSAMSPSNRASARIPARAWAWPSADSDLTGRMDLFVPNDKLMNSFFKQQGRREV